MLKYGAGALNIDATRIGYESGEVDFDRVQRQQHSEGAVTGAFGAAALVGKEIPTYKPGGRWPANLVLQHLEGCVQEGTAIVKSSGHYPASRGAGSTQYTGGHKGQSGLVEHRMGDEAVPAWLCVQGCPVADLDAQSGVSKGTGGRTVTRSGGGNVGSGKTSEKSWSNDHPGFGDTGGASRYFKQVKA